MSETPTTDGRARRWAGHREARRLELVDAACSAIAEHGPEVTTEQIAARAGVSRPGLYRHFEGRDDLQSAIAARSVERLVAELEPVWRPSGRPFDMLAKALRAHLRWLGANGNVYRYLKRTSFGTGGESATTNVRRDGRPPARLRARGDGRFGQLALARRAPRRDPRPAREPAHGVLLGGHPRLGGDGRRRRSVIGPRLRPATAVRHDWGPRRREDPTHGDAPLVPHRPVRPAARDA